MERPIITLISDWGWEDVSLGLMKWELQKRVPDAFIVDLMHDVELLDVGQTAFIMSRLFERFPAGSVHLMLTGVSRWTVEKLVAVQVDGHYFVGIDNGVLPAMLPDGKLPVRHWIGEGSDCLEQMCLLAETCMSGHFEEMTEDAQLIEPGFLPRYAYSDESKELRGNVMYIDRHHNVVTNIPADIFKEFLEDYSFELSVSGFAITKFHERYEQDCEPYLVPNALGVLEIVSYGARLVIVPRWQRDQEIVIKFSELNI